MRKIEILEKSNWYASDIQEFYGISKPYAEKIKMILLSCGSKITILIKKRGERHLF